MRTCYIFSPHPIYAHITSRTHKLVPREQEEEREKEKSELGRRRRSAVTTRHRNSSDEANSRVLFLLDSVPRADSGRVFSSSLSRGEIRRGSCVIAGLSCPEIRSACPLRSGDAHDTAIEIQTIRLGY